MALLREHTMDMIMKMQMEISVHQYNNDLLIIFSKYDVDLYFTASICNKAVNVRAVIQMSI